MNRCDSQHTFVIPDICKILNQKNLVWSDLVAHTYPRIKCPLKPPKHEYRNATTDLSFITYLPLDGYTWTVSVKMFKPIPNVRHKKRLIFCLMIVATILKDHQGPKKEKKFFVL